MARSPSPAYLPSPNEVLCRAARVRFLRNNGFDEVMMRAVMVDESPNINLVRRMVFLHGPREAHRRLAQFVTGASSGRWKNVNRL
jgi:hypothetical protein